MKKMIIITSILLLLIAVLPLETYAMQTSQSIVPEYAQSSVYKSGIVEIDLDESIEAFDTSQVYLSEYGVPDSSKKIRAFEVKDSSVSIKSMGLKTGKRYVLEIKYVRINDKYKNTYKRVFRIKRSTTDPGFYIANGQILNDQIFEVYFNQPISASSVLTSHMRIYDESENLISGGVEDQLEIVHTETLSNRVIYRVNGNVTFEYGKEYKLHIESGFESVYGAKVDEDGLDIYLNRIEESMDVYNMSDAITLSGLFLPDNHIMITFNREMTSTVAPLITQRLGSALPVESYEWILDSNKRQTKLLVKLSDSPILDQPILISGVKKLYTGESFEGITTECEVRSALTIKDISVQDASTLKVSLDKAIDVDGVKDLVIKVDGANATIVKAVDGVVPSVIHVGLTSWKRINEGLTYNISLLGEVTDVYGVTYPIEESMSITPLVVKPLNFKVIRAKYIDHNIISVNLSHPVDMNTNFDKYITVIENFSDEKNCIEISEVDYIDPFTVHLILEEDIDMYDAYLRVENLNDLSGKLRMNGSYPVEGLLN